MPAVQTHVILMVKNSLADADADLGACVRKAVSRVSSSEFRTANAREEWSWDLPTLSETIGVRSAVQQCRKEDSAMICARLMNTS